MPYSLPLALFLAGMLTVLLPCILPLLPVVFGVSIAGRSQWRPLLTILGMLVSFVGCTFLLQVLLAQFVQVADIVRIATYYVLLLFGAGFLTARKDLLLSAAVLGSLFFWEKGTLIVVGALVIGSIAVLLAGTVVARIQQLGGTTQRAAREEFGEEAPWTAFIIGLSLGLVWVPCAGPALGFALTLVRDEPGLRALWYLLLYGLGTALPLLLIAYGGQRAVHSVRLLSRYSGRIKQASGVLLLVCAVAFRFDVFLKAQTWLAVHTTYGLLGNRIEQSLFSPQSSPRSPSPMTLPRLSRAPAFQDLGPWHNSPPLSQESLQGKVVLVDFWTYSCINCIRTLPHIQGYWEKYKDTPFVLLGVHTPEFVFEKDEKNVAAAIKRYGLTYPIAQDNDFGTWNAFANRYWPAKYLIDAEGYIRYTHFGEGGYEETDRAIASLLAEIGVAMPTKPSSVAEEAVAGGRDRTPETYIGERSWPALGNAQGEPSEETVDYVLPSAMRLHRYYLGGSWQLVDGEHQVLRGAEGEIRMRWLGSEINLVLGNGAQEGVQADIEIDGKHVQTITIDRHDLFPLFKGPYGEHDLVLRIHGAGVEAYAFTFGG